MKPTACDRCMTRFRAAVLGTYPTLRDRRLDGRAGVRRDVPLAVQHAADRAARDAGLRGDVVHRGASRRVRGVDTRLTVAPRKHVDIGRHDANCVHVHRHSPSSCRRRICARSQMHDARSTERTWTTSPRWRRSPSPTCPVHASSTRARLRLRLQPRAVGPESVWREDVALMRRSRRRPRRRSTSSAGRSLRAAAGRVRLHRPRPRHRAAARRRHPGQPRHRHRVAAAVAHRAAPRDPAGDGRRHHPAIRAADRPGAPARPVFRAARPRPRRRRSPSATASTRPSPSGTSRTSSAATTRSATATTSARRVPRLARAPLRNASTRSTGVGHALLEPALRRLERDRHRRASRSRPATPARCSTSTGSSSDELLGYYRAEAAVIRGHSERADHHELHGHRAHPQPGLLDLGARDGRRRQRPLPRPPARRSRPPSSSFAADLTRGLAGGEPWMLMEHSTGAVNWQPSTSPRRRADAAQLPHARRPRRRRASASSSGAPPLQGAEKFHSALLPHAGTDIALWREVRRARPRSSTGSTRSPGPRVDADVALLFSWESWWASDAENRPSHEQSRTSTRCTPLYGALRAPRHHRRRRRDPAPT